MTDRDLRQYEAAQYLIMLKQRLHVFMSSLSKFCQLNAATRIFSSEKIYVAVRVIAKKVVLTQNDIWIHVLNFPQHLGIAGKKDIFRYNLFKTFVAQSYKNVTHVTFDLIVLSRK